MWKINHYNIIVVCEPQYALFIAHSHHHLLLSFVLIGFSMGMRNGKWNIIWNGTCAYTLRALVGISHLLLFILSVACKLAVPE